MTDNETDEQTERHACGLGDGRIACIWSVLRMAAAMIGAAVVGGAWCVVRIVLDWWASRR